MVRNKRMKIIVTGGAGFIGSHVVEKLLQQNCEVLIIDNFDNFYDKNIKENNIAQIISNEKCKLLTIDINDRALLFELIEDGYEAIIHLAAKAGVRPSIINPIAYKQTNIDGTLNLLEFAKNRGIKKFIFASSSSVYGINKKIPWQETCEQLLPISPYAATKLSSELFGHVYSNLYGISFIALRFFTVYGPRQRPDLAIHKFTKLILEGKPIPFYGKGDSSRDYTFIDDIVNGIITSLTLTTNFEIINLGNSYTISLKELVENLEIILDKKAILEFLPEQNGDVPITFSDISKAKFLLNYKPEITLKEGLVQFRNWYLKNMKTI